ncbi:sucrose phosphorylase domain-containing protein [Kutzneria buriramensis]|uniref:Uncharacterized protein DUF1964 n=1 Tax=Kutzneria buriramensis TaxID=1045776 RepID=A0A3E0HBW7_9PSEU|nr:sucrose phosphorylase domain-containing protein [Kutzneria buriramensis]REH41881.1 uncharacterized protein DUF1964 [Kutzneria buriramensis]
MDHDDVVRWYGPWAMVKPDDAVALCAGLEVPWWINGGWAIEAYAAVRREHGDIDIGVFERDVYAVIAHFSRRFHVWAVGDGAMKPVRDASQLPSWTDGLWVREHATAPWLLDIQLTGDRDGKWVYPGDSTLAMPLTEATWEARGIRYLRPELVLLFKAGEASARDETDLVATLPWLDAAGRHRCADLIRQQHPAHPWLEILA